MQEPFPPEQALVQVTMAAPVFPPRWVAWWALCSTAMVASVLATPAACGTGTFPVNQSSVQIMSLHQAKAASSVAECIQACCADAKCVVWQFAGEPRTAANNRIFLRATAFVPTPSRLLLICITL